LDPARANARVTRQVAVELAAVARSLEADGHSAHDVAAFLTRCLFSMFAEDVDLRPRTPGGDGAFVDLLKRHRDDPLTLQGMMAALWADMDQDSVRPGQERHALQRQAVKDQAPAMRCQTASRLMGYSLRLASWKEVEPSIFGTLLERTGSDRAAYAGGPLHPRTYVERLVLPTVVEPLRAGGPTKPRR
jgi:hypothetical protein